MTDTAIGVPNALNLSFLRGSANISDVKCGFSGCEKYLTYAQLKRGATYCSAHCRRVAWEENKGAKRQSELDDAFYDFHEANPHVYRMLVAMARRLKARGIDHYSIRKLWHVMEWEYIFKVSANSDFKLNNNYTSRYARLIMEQEPDLDGFFEVRERKP